MANLAGKAYAITVITPLAAHRRWLNLLYFRLARSIPSQLAGLLGLSLIHFARWVIVRPGDWPDLGQPRPRIRDAQMMFLSNFNASWDRYIDGFADGIPDGLDKFWYAARRYPNSIPVSPFKTYIKFNQIGVDHYYNATPGASQRDIKGALRLRAALLRLAEAHADGSPEAFASRYRSELAGLADALGDQGFARPASAEAELADMRAAAAG